MDKLGEFILGVVELLTDITLTGSTTESGPMGKTIVPRGRTIEVDGVEVRLWYARELVDGVEQVRTHLAAGENLGLGPSLWLRPEGVFAAAGEHRLGDPVFDPRVDVRGDEAEVYGRLGPSARQRLGAFLMEVGGTVEDGALRYSEPGELADAAQLRMLIERMAHAASLLRGEPIELLARNAECDRSALVRRRCVLLLLERHPEHEATRAALAAVAGDPDALVRALATGDEAPFLAALDAAIEDRLFGCRALAAIGGRTAVEPLLEHTTGLFADNDVKNAARAAVAAIQQRLGAVEAGSLSLATPAEGAGDLSLADDGGSLSLADE